MKATEEKINLIISRLRSKAELASDKFSDECLYVKELANIGIDIYSKRAVSDTADIVRKTKRACDEFYTTMQSIVITADEQCRPLIEKDPDPASIKTVTEFIVWLNTESNIENSYSASFNSAHFGTVAEVSYAPSLSSRMIQKHWEGKCSEYISDFELKKMSASDEERYQEEYENWAVQLEELKSERDKHFEHRIGLAKKQFGCDEIEKLSDEITSNMADIMTKEVEISEAQDTLNSLGAFNFSEKNHQKSIISEAQAEIKALEDKINTLRQKRNSIDNEIKEKLKSAEKMINNRLRTEFPYPEKPKRPICLKGKHIKEDYTRAGVRAYYSEIILDNLSTDFGMDIPSLQTVPELSEVSNTRINGMLRDLVCDGLAVRKEEDRRAYFYLAE